MRLIGKFKSLIQGNQISDIVDEIMDSLHDYCQRISGFKIPRLLRNSADKLSVRASVRQRNKDGDYKNLSCNIKLFEFFPLSVTLYDHVNGSKIDKQKAGQLYKGLGRVCGKLFEFMRTQCHLKESLKQIREKGCFPWQLVTYEERFRELMERFYPHKENKRRGHLMKTLVEFKLLKNKLQTYPDHILHGDLCGKNILIKLDDLDYFFCLLDFQDIQVGQQVVDLAIMMMYSILEQSSFPFELALDIIPPWILEGYQENTHCHLSDEEISFLPFIMKFRLCQSLLNGQEAYESDPENTYVLESANLGGWNLLNLMNNRFAFKNQTSVECRF